MTHDSENGPATIAGARLYRAGDLHIARSRGLLSAMSQGSRPFMVYALIAANIGVFAVELASGAGAFGATPQHMLQLGGNFAPLTLHGQWWRLGSSMFLHLGVLHLGLNMLCL